MNEIKQIWKPVRELNAEIRTIEKEQDEKEINYYVEVGLFESLGELGGDILTLIFEKEPTEAEIKERILYHLEDLKADLEGSIITDREKMQLKVLNEIL